ncbi:unnamed protein product [Euphydryas editha]|uniref:Uncharacterized protein n=1 Tax=Euphydryas editha TaxID=104508 RepID=A0AAU9TJQ9_EUPED|nr:unnamed protein product [Euphydryas editha]
MKRQTTNQRSELVNSEFNYYISSPTMTARYNYQYQINLSYYYNPGIVAEWRSPVQSSYNSSVRLSSPIMTPQLIRPLCRPPLYPDTFATAESLLSSVGQPVMVPEVVPTINTPEVEYIQERFLTTPDIMNQLDKFSVGELLSQEQNRRNIINEPEISDPFELYLKLPKNLFPTSEMLNLNPNSIIDEFCKIQSIYDHVPWILDLELGVPKIPCPRPIAIYDIKHNNIYSKNAPNTIHPVFEKCNKDFKQVLVDYYDFMVINWYKGYLSLNYHNSLEHFQAWLKLPMQMFGMYWP